MAHRAWPGLALLVGRLLLGCGSAVVQPDGTTNDGAGAGNASGAGTSTQVGGSTSSGSVAVNEALCQAYCDNVTQAGCHVADCPSVCASQYALFPSCIPQLEAVLECYATADIDPSCLVAPECIAGTGYRTCIGASQEPLMRGEGCNAGGTWGGLDCILEAPYCPDGHVYGYDCNCEDNGYGCACSCFLDGAHVGDCVGFSACAVAFIFDSCCNTYFGYQSP